MIPSSRGDSNKHTALAAALAELDMLRRSKPAAVSAIFASEKKRRDGAPKRDLSSRFQHNDIAGDLGTILFPRTAPVKFPVPEASSTSPETLGRTNASRVPAFVPAERIAMISACINSGDLDRAEILFHRSARISGVTEMKNVVSTGMVNAFIEGLLDLEKPPKSSRKTPLERAVEWKGRLLEYDLKPDVITYAILIRYALKKNDVSSASGFLTEMELNGLDTSSLLKNSRFAEPEERSPLESLLRALGRPDIQGKKDLTEEIADHILASTSAESNSKCENDDLILSAMRESVVDEAVRADVKPTPHPLAVEELAKTESLGVNILRQMLSTLNEATYTSKLEKQQLLEEKSLVAAAEEQEAQFERLPKELRTIMQIPSQITALWNRALVPLIRRELESIENATRDADQHPALPFLKLLTAEQMAKITITCFLRFFKSRSNEGCDIATAATTQLLISIGSGIEQEFAMQQLKRKKNNKMVQTALRIHNLHLNGALFDSSVRKIMSIVAQTQAKQIEQENWFPRWPDTVLLQAGSILAALLMKTAKIFVPHPDPSDPHKDIIKEEFAFKHDYISDGTFKRIGVIKTHLLLMEKLVASPMNAHPRLLPMVIKPRPWVTRNSGGYLNYKIDVARTSINPEHAAYIAAADERQHLNHIYCSLDVLGSTPWRVNERVYEVVRKVWNSGEGLGDIPPANLPESDAKPSNWDELDNVAKRAFYLKKKKMDMAKSNAFSQRCEVNYKMEIARAFLGETIYFPHNLDFRGRAYPIPAHFNHMGNDLCRGLLLFDRAKPLGKEGLSWLKIQVANLAGNDKISFENRVKFTEEHMDDVFDSADKPLDGRRWWLKADDPWQLLATCFELADAMRSPNPTEFLSRMPVHQDGTCNGLQHYAALGGDVLGALQVNLLPTEKPSDIYTAVADRVARRIDEDSLKGCPISLKMKGRINRKLVKQTVMTNTYGVTFVGARKQVTSRMREQPELYPFSDDEIREYSLHITRLIFNGLGELFTGARALQTWLNVTARMIAKSVPADAISQEALSDAAFLSKLGCLPRPITIAKIEADAVPVLDDPLHSDGPQNPSLLDAALTDSAAHDVTVEDNIFSGASVKPEAGPPVERAAKSKAKKREKVDRMTTVIWTTALGLPIVQPYRDYKLKQVSTLIQTCTIVDRSQPSPVNPMKQSSAFPPNFIHSLDATHMMLSAIACQRAGIEFASVHDSYWTHACDVKSMSSILRDAFVKLHTQNIMTKLRDEFRDRYKGHKYPVEVDITSQEHLMEWKKHLEATGRKSGAVGIGPRTQKRKVYTWVDLEIPELPERGDLDLEKVKDSPYFFH
ncbi:DNA-directed RNA polymerase [Dinochytrium kinnereticum]|nr:DNA-directed RNA polymerase [Dinochytrium kinnereticum]